MYSTVFNLRHTEENKIEVCGFWFHLLCSNVSCFSGILSIAALTIVGSDRPLELYAEIDNTYTLPGTRPETVNLGTADVIFALIS